MTLPGLVPYMYIQHACTVRYEKIVYRTFSVHVHKDPPYGTVQYGRLHTLPPVRLENVRYGSKMYGTSSHLCSDGSCRLQSRNKSGLFKGYAPRRLSEKGRKFFKRKISLWWSHQDTHSGWNSQKPRMKEKYRYFPLCLSTWKINVTLIFISQF